MPDRGEEGSKSMNGRFVGIERGDLEFVEESPGI